MKIFTDGGARGNPGLAAGAFVVYLGDKIVHEEAKFIGKKTNNVSEYTALIMALSWLLDNSEKYEKQDVTFLLDSELVTKQMQGFYRIKNKNLILLAAKAKELAEKYKGRLIFNFVPREKNKRADRLANDVLDKKTLPLF